jgi:hypothetical protein
LFVSIAADLVPAQNKKLLGILGKAKRSTIPDDWMR